MCPSESKYSFYDSSSRLPALEVEYIDKSRELEQIRARRISDIVTSGHNRLRLMWDPVHHVFINQDDYFRDLKPTDCKSYMIRNVLRAKKMFGQSDIFLKVVVLYVGEVLFSPMFDFSNEDWQYARYMEQILFSNETEEEKLDLIFNHRFWTMQDFTFYKPPPTDENQS